MIYMEPTEMEKNMPKIEIAIFSLIVHFSCKFTDELYNCKTTKIMPSICIVLLIHHYVLCEINM